MRSADVVIIVIVVSILIIIILFTIFTNVILIHPCIHSPMHRHMYTATYLTVCYGWRVGVVRSIVIVTATACPKSDLTYLTYLT